ncbi:hypothetical protein IWW36_000185 [Coemansia brasiliensis]|uniref:RING-type domain-containing protein n=1 Tax=Coemansia brasiliensis TaxID=2650707 RepID=A0A9W8IK67_9FUNG|nr:hypothetical protein IWW36_000185 [Coemansia brasiliensis]
MSTTNMDLKKTFDSICAVSGSVGAVMVREDGTIARASGDLRDEDEAYALSNLMKDAAELMSIVQPDSPALTRKHMDQANSLVATKDGANAVDFTAMRADEQAAYISSLHPGWSLADEDMQREINREIYKQQHQGHEGKHMIMFLIFVCVLAMLPTTVQYWRRRHFTSYRLVSIGSICLIPPYFALGNGYLRFVTIWMAYAIANTYILYLATRKPLYPRTPRRVYQWFALINKASYAVSVVGFVLFALCFFNVAPGMTDSESFVTVCLSIVFYGLYFGLISRDLVTLCADKMAATLGFSTSDGLPTKYLPHGVCCICGDGLGFGSKGSNTGSGLLGAEEASSKHSSDFVEPTHKLDCQHEFHSTCIHGWCVIGKKDMCPFCREKVDLTAFKQNPWDRQELFYVTALEYMRFIISWQPLLLLLLTGIFWVLGLD